MYFEQDIKHLFSGKQNLAHDQVYLSFLKKAEQLLKNIASGKEAKVSPLIEIAKKTSDLRKIHDYGHLLRNSYKHIIVLGTGGSSLSGQALTQLKENYYDPRIHYVDNIDPFSIRKLLDSLDLKESYFLVISKSGTTLETIAQFMIFFDHLSAKLGQDKAARRFLIITEPKESPLSHLAAKYNILTWPHETDIGGRFAFLTSVGLLPAAISGLDITKIRLGAKNLLEENLQKPADSELAKSIAVSLYMTKKMPVAVYMAYLDRLSGFLNLQRQVWAESLGKKGNGTTPVRAQGTIDQHSQLQLYLDGPNDKFFTLFLIRDHDTSTTIKENLAEDAGLNYLGGKSLAEIITAEQQATLETLVKYDRAARVFTLRDLDEETIGALIMHFMMETICIGMLLEINPFDQPAVEEGKIITRNLLSKA